MDRWHQHIKEQLNTDFDLLKKLEDKQRYEDDPLRKGKLDTDIEEIRQRIRKREEDLESLEVDSRLYEDQQQRKQSTNLSTIKLQEYSKKDGLCESADSWQTAPDPEVKLRPQKGSDEYDQSIGTIRSRSNFRPESLNNNQFEHRVGYTQASTSKPGSPLSLLIALVGFLGIPILIGLGGVQIYRQIISKQPDAASSVKQPKVQVSPKGNYSKLKKLLAERKWKEAEGETVAVMLKVSSREKEGLLRKEDIENLPCQDLLAINELWEKSSADGVFEDLVERSMQRETTLDRLDISHRIAMCNIQNIRA